MKAVIHRVTGVEMQVADGRVDKYLAQGHTLKPEPKKPTRRRAAKPKTETTE